MRKSIFRCCFFSVIALMVGTVSVRAFPYQPEGAIMILSESLPGVEEVHEVKSTLWQAVPEENPSDGAVALSFYKESSGSRFARMVLSIAGNIIEADVPGVSPNMMIRNKDFFLIPGFPVPCDILPVHRTAGQSDPLGRSGSLNYKIKRSVGTQTFVDEIEIQSAPVSWETAKRNGWINRDENLDQAAPLLVIQAFNQHTGDVLSLQVWEDGADWWIYEKTKYRQSWRLP